MRLGFSSSTTPYVRSPAACVPHQPTIYPSSLASPHQPYEERHLSWRCPERPPTTTTTYSTRPPQRLHNVRALSLDVPSQSTALSSCVRHQLMSPKDYGSKNAGRKSGRQHTTPGCTDSWRSRKNFWVKIYHADSGQRLTDSDPG